MPADVRAAVRDKGDKAMGVIIKVRDAAERVKASASAWLSESYCGLDEFDRDEELAGHWRDQLALAAAWLDDNPDDSDTAVDEAWLRAVGFADAPNPAFLWARAGNVGIATQKRGSAMFAIQFYGDDESTEVVIPGEPTRGSVRRAATMFGVELKG